MIPVAAYGHLQAALTDALRPPRGAAAPLEVLSSLAAGSDQLFAEIALAGGAELTVVTPAADYATTFTQEELSRFRRLLGRARTHVVLDYPQVSDRSSRTPGRC